MGRKVIYENYYINLFSDGTIGLSDGVGYIDTMDEDETKALYVALKELYNQ